MKNYDETVSAVFDRIRDYNIKKKRRTVLACRVTAACCAVSLLGGSVWYLNRPTHNIPVTLVPDDNTATTTVTTAPTSTENKLLITADKPDDYGVNFESQPSTKGRYISPALEEKMKQSGESNAIYAVVVQLFVGSEELTDVDKLFSTNEEMFQLKHDLANAYESYRKATPEKYSETLENYSSIREEFLRLTFELYGNVDEIEDEIIRIRLKRKIAALEYYDAKIEYIQHFRLNDLTSAELSDLFIAAREKHDALRQLNDELSRLNDKAYSEVRTSILEQRFDTLVNLSNVDPIDIHSTEFFPYYYAELTADAINFLAEQGGYIFRLALPDEVDPIPSIDGFE